MGEIMKITCRSCGESWECMTGCGLKHGRLENAVSLFPKEMQEEIMKQAGTEKFPLFDFAYQFSFCASCNRLESIPILRFLEKDTEYIGNCPICGHEVKLIEDIGKRSCPICGKTELSAEETGQWD